MEYICSDTNVWLDFSAVGRTHLPFMLPYTYIMNSDAIEDEVLSPEGLGKELVALGLQPVEFTLEEFQYAEELGRSYKQLSRYDRIALSIAKMRHIILLTGDKALRKAALAEGVALMGTLGILDQLWKEKKIEETEYRSCLTAWLDQTTYGRRLPKNELQERLRSLGL